MVEGGAQGLPRVVRCLLTANSPNCSSDARWNNLIKLRASTEQGILAVSLWPGKPNDVNWMQTTGHFKYSIGLLVYWFTRVDKPKRDFLVVYSQYMDFEIFLSKQRFNHGILTFALTGNIY